MLVKYKNYYTPTMRHRTREFMYPNLTSKKARLLTTLVSRSSGRNHTGQITVRSRRSSCLHQVPFHEYVDIGLSKFFFKEFIYSPLTKKLSTSVRTASGCYFLLPATKNTFLGRIYRPVFNHDFLFSFVALGLPLLLKNVPLFFKFSNLASFSTIHIQYARSPGTFMTRVKATKKEKLLKTILPSKHICFFGKHAFVIPGVNWDITSKYFEPGKAGYLKTIGRRPTVRGVAKNPVDHPNGGRTKSCQPEKSPWGWVAKKNK